jgi:hypothetical protein
MPDRQSGRSSGVEHNLAKVGVEGSNPFARSSFPRKIKDLQNSRFPKSNFRPSSDHVRIRRGMFGFW